MFTNLQKEYLEQGYVIFDFENVKLLDEILEKIILELEINKINIQSIDELHQELSLSELNHLRLKIYKSLNLKGFISQRYNTLFMPWLEQIVGNELAVQRNVNLSIQIPRDSSSLLPLHSDVWSGDSPFEVVAWMPLVDCYNTSSMFILPQQTYHKLHLFLNETKSSNPAKIYQYLEKDLVFLDMKFGQGLIFNQCLPHGNVVNKEVLTRWSLNCRYKSLLSPYSDKKFGEFFKPLSVKPATINGLRYKV